MKTFLCIVICFVTAGSCRSQRLEDDAYSKMEPPAGPVHPVVLTPERRSKVEFAYAAVLDIEDLADAQVFLPENLDAKRAIRTANVGVTNKDAKRLVDDIETFRMIRETCRSSNTIDDFHRCMAVERKWVDRIRAELGKTAIK